MSNHALRAASLSLFVACALLTVAAVNDPGQIQIAIAAADKPAGRNLAPGFGAIPTMVAQGAPEPIPPVVVAEEPAIDDVVSAPPIRIATTTLSGVQLDPADGLTESAWVGGALKRADAMPTAPPSSELLVPEPIPSLARDEPGFATIRERPVPEPMAEFPFDNPFLDDESADPEPVREDVARNDERLPLPLPELRSPASHPCADVECDAVAIEQDRAAEVLASRIVANGDGTFDFQIGGLRVDEAFAVIAQASKVNLVSSDSFDGTVSNDLFGVTVDMAINALARAHGLALTREEPFVFIAMDEPDVLPAVSVPHAAGYQPAISFARGRGGSLSVSNEPATSGAAREINPDNVATDEADSSRR